LCQYQTPIQLALLLLFVSRCCCKGILECRGGAEVFWQQSEYNLWPANPASCMLLAFLVMFFHFCELTARDIIISPTTTSTTTTLATPSLCATCMQSFQLVEKKTSYRTAAFGYLSRMYSLSAHRNLGKTQCFFFFFVFGSFLCGTGDVVQDEFRKVSLGGNLIPLLY